MRIVLDTAVLVRANVKACGAARTLLERIAAGGHHLVLSPFLLEETARVLNHPRMQALYRLSPAEIQEHIDLLVGVGEIAEAVVASDPSDDPVIYTAIAGRAEVICTLDRDFCTPAVPQFCRMRDIMVMSDAELLRYL